LVASPWVRSGKVLSYFGESLVIVAAGIAGGLALRNVASIEEPALWIATR
jgi:hypothetical protein